MISRRFSRLFLAASFACGGALLDAGIARADGVYKWVSPDGVTHYSSKAPSKDAKPAQLPKIMRGQLRMPAHRVEGCASHGGISCQAGADSDGSVVCVDGYRDATARFRFSCSAPKLQVTDISPVAPDGSYTIFVRNSASVSALRVEVKARLDKSELRLAGPEQIEAFGIGEYLAKPKTGEPALVAPQSGQVIVECANCQK